MTKPSQAYKTMPDVICPTCGCTQPKMSRFPIPADMQLAWNQLDWIEKKLMAGCYLDHLRQPYREWDPMFMAEFAHMKYRQVNNAIRRLKRCGWLHRVRRGVYRVTDQALDRMAWVNPRWTLMTIARAQEPTTEDTGT